MKAQQQLAAVEESFKQELSKLQAELTAARAMQGAAHVEAAVERQLQQLSDSNAALLKRLQQLRLQLSRERRQHARAIEEPAAGALQVSEQQLGRGGSAVVFAGSYRGLPVAVKTFRDDPSDPSKPSFASAAAQAELRRELRVMAAAQHENLCGVLAAAMRKNEMPKFVMELATGGSLAESLAGGLLRENERVLILRDVARGLAWLHGLGIVHLDVKPQNVLLFEGGRAKLSDFGLSRAVDTMMTQSSAAGKGAMAAGTLPYMSPELLEQHERGAAADVYAFGITVWEAMQDPHMPPWRGLSRAQVIAKVVAQHERPQPPVKKPSRVGLLAGQCLLHDPQMRPSMEEAARQLDWALASMGSEEEKEAQRQQMLSEAKQLKALLHAPSQESSDQNELRLVDLHDRAREIAVALIRGGLKGIRHLVVGWLEPGGKLDVSTAAECLGRMRAGRLDEAAVQELARKAGADKARLAEEAWRTLDKRGLRTETVLLLRPDDADGEEEQLASVEEILDQIVDAMRHK